MFSLLAFFLLPMGGQMLLKSAHVQDVEGLVIESFIRPVFVD